MKRSILFLVAPCLCAAALNSCAARVEANRDDPDIAAIDAFVTAKMRSSHIPGVALGIVKEDRAAYLKGYGVADASGRPVTPHTPFQIGSITKPFTALAVMQLVEAGRVELDAPVQRYVPWFRLADRQAATRITVRHLLTMTSGLPQSYETQLWTDQDDAALERAVRLLASSALSRPVGSFGYSNTNSEILGLIVQTVSGLSYEEYVKGHIFVPLGMRDSFVSQDEARRHGMASGYRWWFGIPVPVMLPDNRAELPAGHILSSAEDMSHFLVAQMNGGRYDGVSVLSAAGIALTHHEPVPDTYGMGWESTRADGRMLIGHDGGTANSQSSLFFDPDARVGVFIAANVINALDAFSSPHGSSPLDGVTARAMAQSVLSLATNRPLPSQGQGHERLTLIFNLVILALTALLARSLVRIPRRRRLLLHRGIASWSAAAGRGATIAVSHFSLLAIVWYLALNVPAWSVIVTFQPDLGYWLYAVAAVLFFKGLFEMASAWNVFSVTQRTTLRRWSAEISTPTARTPFSR